jgi:hypothetical protein
MQDIPSPSPEYLDLPNKYYTMILSFNIISPFLKLKDTTKAIFFY